jgi:hypothetical protein
LTRSNKAVRGVNWTHAVTDPPGFWVLYSAGEGGMGTALQALIIASATLREFA